MTEAAISKWRGVLWIAGIITVLYAIAVYNSFFVTELGYVYDPATDRLFEIHLTPSITTCDKWTLLIPLKYCLRGEVGEVHDKGTLEAIEANRKLGRENPKWMEKQKDRVDALLSDTSTQELLPPWSVNYYWTPAVPVSQLLPKRLSKLNNPTTDRNVVWAAAGFKDTELGV